MYDENGNLIEDEDTTLDDQNDPDTTDEDTSTEDSTDADTKAAEEYEVKYNGKVVKLKLDEVLTNAQKGMNYDYVKGELEAVKGKSTKAETELARLTSALAAFNYTGSAQDMADMLEAQAREIDPSQVKAEREAAEAATTQQTAAEKALAEAQRIQNEAVYVMDLAEIQRINPNVKSLKELGDTFFKLRAAGIENLAAYELVRKSNPKPTPDNSGKDHLRPTGGGTASGSLKDIPKSELGFWRDNFPDDSPDKLKERYNRATKRQN